MAIDRRIEGDTILRKTQLTQVYLLEVLDEICQKHGIRYWLMDGTLLGALRHNGFIPWDDDIDVGMLKKDYRKFKYIINQELPKDIYFENEMCMHNTCPCGKLRDLKSFFFNGMGNANEYDRKYYGIPLDIFPFIRTPRMPYKWLKVLLRFRHGPYQRWHDLMNRQRRSIFLKLCDLVLAAFWKCIHCISIIVWNILAILLPSRLWHVPPESGFSGRIMEEMLTSPMRKHIFEGREYPIPLKSEEYLTMRYGKWQEIPPLEKRPRHSQFVIPEIK